MSLRYFKNIEDVLTKDKEEIFIVNNLHSDYYTNQLLSSSSNQLKYLNNFLFIQGIIGNKILISINRNIFKDRINNIELTINSVQYITSDQIDQNCIYQNYIIKNKSNNTNSGILIKNLGIIVMDLSNNNTVSITKIQCVQKLLLNNYFCKLNFNQFNNSQKKKNNIKNTYFNTIGLYDSSNNLLAVARLSQNIKKNDQETYSFKVSLQV